MTYHGRRLRCDDCRARVPESEALKHHQTCGGTLSWPYTVAMHPEIANTKQAKLTELVE